MGICASCLGVGRRSTQTDEDDAMRLLFEEGNGQYGTFGDQHQGTVQADPLEVQREAEALLNVVAHTSNHLVDIFAMAPQNDQRVPSPIINGQQDARLSHYQEVLAKISRGDSAAYEDGQSQAPREEESEWLSEREEDEGLKGAGAIKTLEVGPLLGGFADIERQAT